MNPSWGEFPFSYVRVGESVTDFAFSAMFFRKFIFFHGNQLLVIPGCGGAPPPSLFHFHRKMTEEGGSMGSWGGR